MQQQSFQMTADRTGGTSEMGFGGKKDSPRTLEKAQNSMYQQGRFSPEAERESAANTSNNFAFLPLVTVLTRPFQHV
jgi:hypothetical protein